MKSLISVSALALMLSAAGVLAQATPSASPPSASSATVGKAGVILTDAQALNWIKKAVYSNENKNVGEVTKVQRDSSGKVTSLQIGIGGFLGMGETLVDVAPAQFNLENDRVLLQLTGEQVKELPKSAK